MEAFNARDLHAAADALDHQVEWDAGRLIDEGPIRGRAAVLRFWERMLTTMPFTHERLRFLEAGDDVCVLAEFRAVGAGSGVEVDQPCGYAMTLRAGAVTRVRF